MTVPPGWGTHCLATDKVRFVGEPVAAVAAVSRYVAEDALELISVEYEPLPALADAPRRRSSPAARCSSRSTASNVMLQKLFTWGDVDAAFAGAAHVVAAAVPLEPARREPARDLRRREPVGPRRRRAHLPRQLPGAGPLRDGARAWSSTCRSTRCASSASRTAAASAARAARAARTSPRSCRGRPAAGRSSGSRTAWSTSAGGASQAWDRHYDAAIALDADGKVTRLQGEAARRPRGHGRRVGRGQRREAAHQLHRLLRDPGGAVRPHDRRDQQAARKPLPRHGPAAAQLGARAADGSRGPQARARPGRDPAPQFHPARGRSRTRSRAATSTTAATTRPRSSARSRWPTTRRSRAEQDGARAEGRLPRHRRSSTRSSPASSTGTPTRSSASRAPACPRARRSASTSSASSRSRSASRSKGRGSTRSRRRCSPTGSSVDIADVRVVALDTLSAPPHFGPGGSRARRRAHRRGARRRAASDAEADRGRGGALPDDARARRAPRRHDRREGHARGADAVPAGRADDARAERPACRPASTRIRRRPTSGRRPGGRRPTTRAARRAT